VRDPSPRLAEALGSAYAYVVQETADGTGGALRRAVAAFSPQTTQIAVINSDTPFISTESLRRLAAAHIRAGAALTLLTAREAQSSGLGRVLYEGGEVAEIVEASAEGYTRTAEAPVNCGAYCIDAQWLRAVLPKLPLHGNEYYLTDLVTLARSSGRRVEAVLAEDPWEALGVNTRVDLARAEQELRQRTIERLMLEGVTVMDPATTYVDAGVRVGQDTVIRPNTYLYGKTVIGEECVIGPGSQIVDSQIGNRCKVWSSALEEATLEDDVNVGPFSHLRPGAYICQGVHIGNFGEIKKSRLGRGVKMGHFGYVGDASIGADTNLGAGMITCNFDGIDHHPTEVGEDAFIGSDTMLVAPVKVGARSATGAGAVVTADVPPDTVVVGVPARKIPSKTPWQRIQEAR